MTTTNNNGSGPGQVTPEKTKGTADGQVNNPQNTTNNSADFKSKIIAECAKVKGAASVFCLRKMIGWQSGLLFFAQAALGFYWMALVYGGWRAFQ